MISYKRVQPSYIGTLYLLTSTAFLPLFASIADIYGRHFAMQLSLIFFLFGSALSTGARNMQMMLAGRAVAGIGAAGLLTVCETFQKTFVSNFTVSAFFPPGRSSDSVRFGVPGCQQSADRHSIPAVCHRVQCRSCHRWLSYGCVLSLDFCNKVRCLLPHSKRRLQFLVCLLAFLHAF